ATTETKTPSTLITPYGGQLVDLMVPAEELAEARAYANTLPSIQISARSVCDIAMLAGGHFSPLDRLMSEADYRRVVHEMRLENGAIFPIPVTLPVSPEDGLKLDTDIVLRDAMNDPLAIMTVEKLYSWDAGEISQF